MCLLCVSPSWWRITCLTSSVSNWTEFTLLYTSTGPTHSVATHDFFPPTTATSLRKRNHTETTLAWIFLAASLFAFFLCNNWHEFLRYSHLCKFLWHHIFPLDVVFDMCQLKSRYWSLNSCHKIQDCCICIRSEISCVKKYQNMNPSLMGNILITATMLSLMQCGRKSWWRSRTRTSLSQVSTCSSLLNACNSSLFPIYINYGKEQIYFFCKQWLSYRPNGKIWRTNSGKKAKVD